MFDNDTLQYVTQWGVPVVSVGITYCFSIFKESRDRKREILKERYSNAYLPCISNLFRLYAFNSVGHYMVESRDTRCAFLDLLTDNLHYWDKSTIALYPKFYKAFLDMLEFENGNEDYQNAPVVMESISNEITLAILKAAKDIEADLGCTSLSEAFYPNYLRNKRDSQR